MRRIALLLLVLSVSSAAVAGEFRVVAHPNVPVTWLTKNDASALFLKKTLKWSDGTPVVALDQLRDSSVRASFTSAVHGKNVAAVTSFWNQQIFSGRNVPPVETRDDAEAVALIRSTPGAIGYVSDKASTGDLKVIQIR